MEGASEVSELFIQLIGVVITLLIAYCFFKAHQPTIPPFRASVYSFILAIVFILVFILVMLRSPPSGDRNGSLWSICLPFHSDWCRASNYERLREVRERCKNLDKYNDTSYGDNRLFDVSDGLSKYKVSVASTCPRFRWWFSWLCP